MSNELVKVDSATLDGALAVADALQHAEGMIPKAFLRQPGKILAAILTGRELGVGPMASMRAFHVVEGRPCADYSFWIARLKQAGYRVQWTNCTSTSATLMLTSPQGDTHEETWDENRAKRAGLWNRNGPWKTYPETMLKARCVTSAGRAFAGEVMAGCYELDEAEEIERTISPSQPPAATALMVGANGKRGAARVQAMLEASEEPAAETTVAVEEPQQPAEVSLAEIARDIATRAKARGWTLEDMQFAQESVGIVPPKKLAECNADELRAIGEFMGGDQ